MAIRVGIIGGLFLFGSVGSLIAYVFFPDTGSRPNEERLDTFWSCGIVGTILLNVAWNLRPKSKRK